MKYPVYFLSFALLLAGLSACQKNAPKADAYGNFEAEERIIKPPEKSCLGPSKKARC